MVRPLRRAWRREDRVRGPGKHMRYYKRKDAVDMHTTLKTIHSLQTNLSPQWTAATEEELAGAWTTRCHRPMGHQVSCAGKTNAAHAPGPIQMYREEHRMLEAAAERPCFGGKKGRLRPMMNG